DPGRPTACRTDSTQQPVAFTSARACTSSLRPCRSMHSATHPSASDRALLSCVRVNTSAPREAASRALSTTRRQSFHPAVRVAESMHELGFEGQTRRIRTQADLSRGRQALAAAQVIVEEQAEADLPERPKAR